LKNAEKGLGDVWRNIQKSNLYAAESLEEERSENGLEKYFPKLEYFIFKKRALKRYKENYIWH
jgi:hypothetical protein